MAAARPSRSKALSGGDLLESRRPSPASFRACAALRRRAVAMVAVAIACTVASGAGAEDRTIAAKRAGQRTSFSDAQIIDGFFKVTFGAEFHTDGRVDRIRKYDGPVRVYVTNNGEPDRRPQLETVIADIRTRVKNLDIAITNDRRTANMRITLVNDRDLNKTISTMFGRERGRKIEHALEPQCLAAFRKDDNFKIIHAEVILVVDAGDFIFHDCAYEETLQALGPINDDDTVPWTMFNDKVQLGYFDVYDQYLLNLLYHPRIRAGMTREEVHAILPEILPEIRAFVAQTNHLAR
jgi:hypothetical protein